MPQLKLEYTANVIENNDFPMLFDKLHHILAEKLPTDIASCKSRAVLRNDYYIGDGDPNNAFVCLHLQVMAGRSPEVLKKVAQMLLEILTDHFSESLKQRSLQITLEVQELPRELYFKIVT